MHDELAKMGMEFLSTVRERAELPMEGVKPVFDFVVAAFLKEMPDKPVPSLDDVAKRFEKALPGLVTNTCMFIEQIRSMSESAWSK